MSDGVLTLDIPDAFLDLYQPKRYKCWWGGRGSAKSWAFAQALLILGARKCMRILACREFQNSIADSVHRLLSDQIERLHLSSFYTVEKNTIKGRNGTLFIFEGLRSNLASIKSIEGIDVAWIEEANTVSNDSLDVLIPTVRRAGSELWFSFNPDQEDDPVYKRFVLAKRDDAVVVKVTHRDNPWFGQTSMAAEMEYDRANDTEKYEHVWEGGTRKYANAAVFAGKWVVRDFQSPTEADWMVGADWGYATDPSTAVRCYQVPNAEGPMSLHVDAELYGHGIEIPEIPDWLLGILPHPSWPVRADSARPEIISYLNNLKDYSFKILSVKKGPGSIDEGIKFLRSYKEIVVHPRCVHTIDEMRLYSYKVDRATGEVLPIIVDKHNQICDPLRYATEPLHGIPRWAPPSAAWIESASRALRRAR